MWKSAASPESAPHAVVSAPLGRTPLSKFLGHFQLVRVEVGSARCTSTSTGVEFLRREYLNAKCSSTQCLLQPTSCCIRCENLAVQIPESSSCFGRSRISTALPGLPSANKIFLRVGTTIKRLFSARHFKGPFFPNKNTSSADTR